MDLLKIAKNPITPERPTGGDVRFEAEFEALQAEVEKPSSLSSSGATDWDRVLKLACAILEARSKDLLVMNYLSFAMLQKEGLPGLAAAMQMLRAILENFWEPLFPNRMRARKNAFDWWLEKMDLALPSVKPERWPPAAREAFVQDMQAIDTFLGGKMEEAPILTPLFGRLASLIEVEGAESAAQGSPAPPTKADKRAPGPEKIEDGNDEKMLRQGLEILGRVSILIAGRNPFDPLRFRLNRIAAWAGVTAPPPAADGRTLIPPPDEQVVALLKNMYAVKNWAELLEAAESRLGQFLFWIDLSRLVCECLDNLGHGETGSMVAAETWLYAKRLPGVEQLAFADGTPFAEPATREWLRNLFSHAGTRPEAPPEGGQELERQITAEIAAARNMIQAEGLGAALRAFREKLKGAPSIRERFQWLLGFCRLLHEAKQPRLASPYWRDLLRLVENHRLEEWQPELAVEAMTVVLTGMRLDSDGKGEEQRKALIERISALDPGRALDFL